MDFIITVDRSMMTDHHGKEFMGFMTTAPPIILPERIWNWISMPKMKVDKLGRPYQAPYGLRKIEAALIDAGFDACVVDPDHIHRYVDSAKAILIGHHDYFALCPPSSGWWILTKKEPVNARSFRRFMESKAMIRARRKGVKIIVGGPAAWQWLYKPELIERWKISCIIDGEAEKVIVDIAERILRGEEIPRYVYVGAKDSPNLEEIPTIKYPSINGLIEVMRGCPRKCKFCSVTLRKLRHYTFDMIERELKVNVRGGVRRGIIHSEDVLLYGANGVRPNPEKLVKLHELVKKYYKSVAWSHVSLSAVKYAEEEHGLIRKLVEIIDQDFIGVEVGIETGSPELAKKIMPAKAKPYDIEDWPEIVVDAFAIMHENNVIPAATIIVGLPGETEADVIKTIELVERLREYRSLIIPMYFVPMGAFKRENWYKEEIRGIYMELAKVCLKHDVYWTKKLLNFYFKGRKYIPLKALIWLIVKGVEMKTRNINACSAS
jgi:radical SAM superfamily enzyme YgiQ (UPF0313 family)